MEFLSEISHNLISSISIPTQEWSILEGFIRFLYNRSVEQQNTSYGLLIQYEKQEQYDLFLKELENAIGRLGLEEEYQILLVSETNLLKNKKNLSKYFSGNNTILALKECLQAGSLDELADVFSDTPEIIKIVGADAEIVEKRFSENPHFRYRLLCRQIHLGRLQADDISTRFIERMHSLFKTEKAFDEEIRYYIGTIYEGADYQEQEFIDDLMLRIKRQMSETTGINSYLRGDAVVGAEFVPYSLKVEERKGREPTKETVDFEAEENPWLPEVGFPMWLESNDLNTQVLTCQDKTAVILLFLSDYRSGNSSDYYQGKYLYKGIQTNDAPVQFLIDEALTNGCSSFEFLCLTSDKVANTPVNDSQTAFSRFEELAEACFGEIKKQKEDVRYKIHQIQSGFYRTEDGIVKIDDSREIAKSIFVQVKEILVSVNSVNSAAYVDYTGGLRDISFLMIVLLRYLQFTGIKCEKVVYSNFQKNPKQIENLQFIYDLLEMISGTDSFTSTANAEPLQKFFEHSLQSMESDTETQHFLEAVQQFSKAISICDVKKIDGATKQIDQAIHGFENSSGQGLEKAMLKSLIPTVKEKLYMDKFMVADGKINYPLLIRWCLDNNLLQQAATLYVEKIPFYYFDHSILSELIDLNTIEEKASTTKQADAVYTYLYDLVFHRLDRDYTKFCEKVAELAAPLVRNEIVPSDTRPVFENVSVTSPFTKEFKQIQNLINRCYSNTGDLLQNAELPENCIYGTSVKQAKLRDFLNALKRIEFGKDSIYRHYAFYQDQNDYQRLQSKKPGIENTSWNKWLAVEELYSGDVKSLSKTAIDELKLIMGYYLAIKLLRNQMNHASEKEESEIEAEVKEKLSNTELPDGNKPVVSMDFESIKTLLLNAIAFIPDLEPIRYLSDEEKEIAQGLEQGSESAAQEVKTEKSVKATLDLPKGEFANPKLVKEAAEKIIELFNKKHYPEEGAAMMAITDDAAELKIGLPTKKELGKPLMNCLVTGYPDIFHRVENPENKNQPFLKLVH